MSDSPVSGLFHTVQKVYAPVLSQSKGFDPNLQSLLMQLEAGLGSVIRKTSGSGRHSLDDGLGGNYLKSPILSVSILRPKTHFVQSTIDKCILL